MLKDVKRVRAVGRLLMRGVRHAAKKCVGAAVYGMGLSWTVGYATFYTTVGLFVTGLAVVVSAVVACFCVIFSGE